MTVLIDELRKAGVNLDVQALDWSTITARRAKKDPPDKGGWNLFITSAGGPDVASPMASIWFNSSCAKANVGWPCDPELNTLVDQWAQQADPAKRHALIDGIQTRAYISVPYVIAGQYFQPIAFRANIKGVLEAGVPVYWNIEKQ
jgi:peptide/nickel transport system substrate-binding protein